MSIIGRVAAFFNKGGPRVYATLNPLDKNVNVGLTGGNLIATLFSGAIGVRANIGKSAGKWSWEVIPGISGDHDIGIATASYSLSTWLGNDANGVGYDASDGKLYLSGAATVTGWAPYASGDVIRFELDCGAKTLAVFKNNVLQGTYTYSFTGLIFPTYGPFSSGLSATFNFGATAFVNAPSAGFNVGVYN